MQPLDPTSPRFRAYTQRDLDRMPHLESIDPDLRLQMKAVASVLPFRVNSYVLDELIDWDNVPYDPMFQLTFPQPGMLTPRDLARMVDLYRAGASRAEIEAVARRIQMELNPHPAGQMDLNVPRDDADQPIPGMQHKYRETVLFFPGAGQTCHAWCTYCFRWAQFVGMDELKFAAKEPDAMAAYLRRHPEVTSVLFTGGDPMVMRTTVLRRYVEPVLDIPTVTSIRLGTKSLAWWPYRFTTDSDADDLLRLFEDIRARGKHVAVMGHYTHPAELATPAAEAAVERVVSSGAVIRSQSPVIRHINDSAAAWRDMWERQVRLGVIPYYMFVERDTGARDYFAVPLAEAFEIYNHAVRTVTGLGRTVRGPSMSAAPGKVLVDGVTEIAGRKVFVLRMIQARDPSWTGRVFFADYSRTARWLDELRPAFGEPEFFFEPGLRAMTEAAHGGGPRAGGTLSEVARQFSY